MARRRTGNSGMLRAWLPDNSAVNGERDTVVRLRPGEQLTVDLASGGYWYGHGFSHVQPYPLETGSTVNAAFAVNNIQSPIWMCSAGYVLFARTNDPLDVSINKGGDGLLAIRCQASGVDIEIIRRADLKEANAELLRRLRWPNRAPAPEMFGDSIFCTWTQYPRCLTQERIVDMARKIRSNGYPCSTLIVDDRWESCFGELTFSRDFADPKGMVDQLHALGFKVWLWVTPFVNQEAAVFSELAKSGVLVRAKAGAGAAMMKWWGGVAGLIDVTSKEGRAWYKERLMRLRNEFHVDGFKIDGGDFKYQPAPEISAWAKFAGASGYSDSLLSLFEEICPNSCETRTAWLSQGRDIIWREGGKDSHWGLDNGLKAMVTLGLNISLMGYDLLIPDMVPGRVQTMVSDMPLPPDELMVRWTEASAFFPMIQFSYLPWNYAEPTAKAVNGFAMLHKALERYIHEQAKDRTAPLLRPLWYAAPGEKGLYPVADEFMLGADLLVAPVLDPGVVSRDVILPPGDWIDAWSGKKSRGGVLRNHPAPCPGIPIFVRDHRTDVLEALGTVLPKIIRGSVQSGITTATYRAGLDRDLSVTG